MKIPITSAFREIIAVIAFFLLHLYSAAPSAGYTSCITFKPHYVYKRLEQVSPSNAHCFEKSNFIRAGA